MSSKHETALALIDEQIDKEEEQLKKAADEVAARSTALKRAQDEKTLIEWSLKELRNSRGALLFDRDANRMSEEPSEVP